MSQRSFGRLVGYKHPNINGIIKDKRTPPLAHVSQWAKALDLSPSQTHDFIVAAWLANAPPELREYVNGLIKLACKSNQSRSQKPDDK